MAVVGSRERGLKVWKRLLGKLDQSPKTVSLAVSRPDFFDFRKYLMKESFPTNRIDRVDGIQMSDRSVEFLMRNLGGGYRWVKVGEKLSLPSNRVSPVAATFSSVYGITDPTESTQLETLRLVAAGIGTKIKAIYPMAGTTELQHSGNLMVAALGNAAYQLTFNGVWTHNADGIKSDGLNTSWADTHFAPAAGVTTVPNLYIGAYMKENTSVGSTMALMGCKTASPNTSVYLTIEASNFGSVNGNVGGVVIATQSAASNYGSYISASRESSTLLTLRRRTTTIATIATSVTTLPIGRTIYIGAFNFDGTTTSACNRTFRTVVIADGLTSSEHTTLFNAIEAWETFKGRNIA